MDIKPGMGRLLPLVLLLLWPMSGRAEQVTEYAVKAAIAHKITKFVSWPTESGSESELMRFCVAGDGPILAELAKLQGYSVRGRTPTVHSVTSPDEVIGFCDVLYLGDEVDKPQEWLNRVSHAPVLTFGEIKGGGDARSVVVFSVHDNKVRFYIDVAASEKAGLTIGAQLLQLAALSSGR